MRQGAHKSPVSEHEFPTRARCRCSIDLLGCGGEDADSSSGRSSCSRDSLASSAVSDGSEEEVVNFDNSPGILESYRRCRVPLRPPALRRSSRLRLDCQRAHSCSRLRLLASLARGVWLPWQSSLASPDGITGGRTAPAPVAPAPTMVAGGCGVLAPALGDSLACASGQPLQEAHVAVVPEFLTFSCSSSVTLLTLISVRGFWSSCITLSGIRAPHGSVHAGVSSCGHPNILRLLLAMCTSDRLYR